MTGNTIIYNQHFFIVTGGPGSGKTTLLEQLQQKFRCIPEAARQIIIAQMNMNGDALPWKNKERYKQLMMEQSVSAYQVSREHSPAITLFDRGIPDTLAYAKLEGLAITETMNFYAQHYRYNRKVFILPPWKDIYTTDTERKQTWKEAVATYQILASTYREYGYDLVKVPKTTVAARADFINETISQTELRL